MHEPIPSDASARRPVFFGVFLMSMAVLVLQIALTRIFSFTIWYHFAYVSISVALLGYGASGSLLSVAPSLARHLPSFALASSASVIVTLLLCAWLPFEPFRIRSAPLEQIPLMLAYYLGVTAPFFLAGICISAALKRYSQQVGRLYFFDLAGASLGCLIVVFAIERFGTPGVVVLASGLAGLAAAAFAASRSRALAGAVLAAVACVVALGAFASARLEFRPSPEKFLSGFLGSPAVRIYTQKWTPIFRTDVFGFVDEEASRGISYANWGISRAWARNPANRGPKLRGIAHDGDACAVIYNFDGDLSKLEMFDHHVLKTPYLLLDEPAVLVIGAGGGTDVLNAVKNGARHVTGVELDPVTVEAVARDHADFTGRLYERPDVTVVAGEGRSTLRHSEARYDLIQLSGVDTAAALTTGAYVLSESYLYTVEAVEEFLDHLTPDGMIAFAGADYDGQVKGFPRHSIRQINLYIEALRRRGIDDPERHVAVVASSEPAPQVVMLLRPRPFTPEESARLQAFADEMGFEIWARPGISVPRLHSRLLRARGETREHMLRRFPLRLNATSDDNPFFFNFYKWRHLHQNLEVDVGHTLATGQIVMALILATSILASVVLVLGPLAVFQRKGLQTAGRWGFVLFFLGIGLGFILVEISFVQKLVLFLGYPTYSLTVVLFSLLLFSGIGSYGTSRMSSAPARRFAPLTAGLVVVGLLYALLLPALLQAFLGEPLPVRVGIAVALLVPLGLLMGMFFPSGIQIVREANPDFVPWAWAINGCGSVVGTILSVILAMTFGFRFVTYVALVLYVLAALGIRAAARSSTQKAQA